MSNAHFPRNKTSPHRFYPCNPAQNHLFSVCEGIPSIHALEQVSVFLSLAEDITAKQAESATSLVDGFQNAHAALHFISLSKALLNSVVSDMLQHQQD